MGYCWGEVRFVQYASHRWATWLHDLVRLAAENHLMMNIHDEYRPSGFSRTYPNLLTQEGICGNEEFPDATHNVTLPFTRMINGAADYTICYFDKRLKTTHAHQLRPRWYSTVRCKQSSGMINRLSIAGNRKWNGLRTCRLLLTIRRCWTGHRAGISQWHAGKGQEWFLAAMTNNDGLERECTALFSR